jgi:glyoxylase-like metal-dependent hydrolase (beta-lactamase superfamily II)
VGTANQLEHIEENEARTYAFLLETLREFGAPPDLVEKTAEARNAFSGMSAPVVVQQRLEEGRKALGFDVYYAPGHSSTDTLFVDAARRFAFSGDHVLKRISPNPLMRRLRLGEPRAKSLVEYQHSLRRTRELDLEVCYPGHGEPITGHRTVIDTLLERQDRRTTKIKTIIESREMTPHQLCNILFPDIDPQYYYLGVSVAIGHLEVLEDRGEIVGDIRDGVLVYTAASHAAR